MGTSDRCPVPSESAAMNRYFHNMGHSLLSYRTPDHSAAVSQAQLDDDTNPLFISAVRIFLEYVREKHGVTSPEKCSLDQLIMFLGEFQETAKTKKGERYSPSTIRVIRYSLNRVIALGKSQQEMRPYPAQNAAGRKRKKNDESRSTLTTVLPSAGSCSDDVHFVRQSPPRLFGLPYNTATEVESFSAYEKLSKPHPLHSFSKTIPVDEVYSGKFEDLEIFRRWLLKQRIQPTFENLTPLKLSDYLTIFFRSNAHSGAMDPEVRELLVRFRAAISGYLQRNGIDFENDRVYEPAREAYRASMRSTGSPKYEAVKRQKKAEALQQVPKSLHIGTEWLEMPTEFIKSLYRTGTLSTSSAVALQRKVWFELTMFFRSIPCCPDQIFWTKNTFKVAIGEHSVKYIELNPEMYSRYGNAMERRGQDGRIMVERKGSPLCPVASFELYLSCLDPCNECLFPPVLLNTAPSNADVKPTPTVARNSILYGKRSLTSEILSEMMANIATAGRIPFRFSNPSVAATDHLAWLRAVTAVELEVTCATEMPSASPEEAVSPFVRNSVAGEVGVSSPRQSVIQSARKFSQMSSCVSDAAFSASPRSNSPLASDRSTCSSGERDNRSNHSTEEVWNKKTKLLRYVEEAKKTEAIDEVSVHDGYSESSAECVREFLGKWCSERDFQHMLEHNRNELDSLIYNNLVKKIGEGCFNDRNEVVDFRSRLSSLLSKASGNRNVDGMSAQCWPVKTFALLQTLLQDRTRAEAEVKMMENHKKSPVIIKTEPVDIWMIPSDISHSSSSDNMNSPQHSSPTYRTETNSDIMVIVRPQISIIDNVGALADIEYQAAFDRRIKSEVEKAIQNVDWNAAVDHAIRTARSQLSKPVFENGNRNPAHQSESRGITLPKTENSNSRSPAMESEEFMGQLSKEMMEEVYQDVCCNSPAASTKTDRKLIAPSKLIRRRSSSLSVPQQNSPAL
ncbi:uncharacterized protein LOC129588056 isoform X2 [Paramacrobiotus metropolitanus]|uniref:uncharacterized protein LOC129588056 isoform X2 n=1 Tax=Paramacrobiotus metropolitanus TaxID=2943436 RepID=UPI002445FC99|nr:uncharacterized protein LOC129588056 isoform X2 [Paramacrobiotus metropolitanus]